MTSSKTYTAIYDYEADDRAWNVRIKGVTGCQTYGRSLRQAQSRIREALALWLDVAPVDLLIRDQFPAPLASVADDVARARTAAELGSADEMPLNSSACHTNESTNSSEPAESSELPIGSADAARLSAMETGDRMLVWCEGGPSNGARRALPAAARDRSRRRHVCPR